MLHISKNAPEIVNSLLEEFGKNLDAKKLNHLLEKHKENILKQERMFSDTSLFGRAYQLKLKLLFDKEYLLTITEINGKRLVEIRD